MKVECKLHDYFENDLSKWKEAEDRVIFRRPWNGRGMVQILIGTEIAEVDWREAIEAIKACAS